MKPVTLPPLPPDARTNDQAFRTWVINSLQAIERNSHEEPAEIFDSYSSDSTPTATRQVLVTSPTTANLAAVIATLIADWRARGVKRTAPT